MIGGGGPELSHWSDGQCEGFYYVSGRLMCILCFVFMLSMLWSRTNPLALPIHATKVMYRSGKVRSKFHRVLECLIILALSNSSDMLVRGRT